MTGLLVLLKDKRKLAAILMGFVLLAGIFAIQSTGWLAPLERLVLDGHFKLRGTRTFPSHLAIVGIDEPSIDQLGHWPWSRDAHANLIHLLHHAPFRPAALAYDVLFENKDLSSPKSDEVLIYQATKFGDSLILVYFFESGNPLPFEISPFSEKQIEKFVLPTSHPIPEDLHEVQKVSLPFPELAKVSSLAFANNPVDSDGRTRAMQLLIRFNDKLYPSLTLLAALKYLGAEIGDVRVEERRIMIEKSKIGSVVIPITASGSMLINFYGGSQQIPTYSFIEVLNDGKSWIEESEEPVILRSLKDKIVLVGATALGLQDRRVTPFHRYDPAISVQAQAITNILDQNFLKRAHLGVTYATLALVGILAVLIIGSMHIFHALPATAGLGLLHLAIGHFLFVQGLWIDTAVHQIALVILFISITSFRYFLTAEDLKRTYQQLVQAEKMASLGLLSASIAHEYRNILSTVSMAQQACVQPDIPKEKFTEFMGLIKTACDKANQISNSLLTFARKKESVRQTGDLRKTVEDILLLVRKNLMEHRIKVHSTLDQVSPVPYDEGQISQVLLNMINNARDALKEKEEDRQVTLRLEEQVENVLLEISDNGCGIPQKVMKHLFEPFTTTKKKGEGTGLGLSVCHGIIQNHGGSIKVSSTAGKGTTWHITLPKS